MAKGFKISQIKFDDRNANKHNAFGMQQLENSIEQNGVIEAVTISADNVAISGNARTEKFYQKGLEDCILVETDGTKPVIIKRTDIKSKSKKFYNAALAANVVAKNNIVLDAEVVDAICEEFEIEEWKDNSVNYSEKNKEIDIDELDTEMVIKLHFPEDEYHLVKGQLSRIAETPEKAIWKLLGNE